ncbi:protein translocase subunit SecD [Ihubacter sp. rT4E-8]|uniref:protein translocase subunit SecD n=1 Tax=Ihubacter sp. rT4E-8 TaxID=3242369 RepID=UPI003CE791B6
MNAKLRKVLAGLVVIAVLFGWYVTVFGIGSVSSIKDVMKFGLDINGGVYVVLEADDEDIAEMSSDEIKEVMEQTRAVLNKRVNAMGISEATVSLEGNDRLRVEMPGVDNAQQAIEQIGKTAQLRFLLADGSPVLTGEDVKDAYIDTDNQNGGYKIVLEFTTAGSDKFAEGTGKAASGQVVVSSEFSAADVQSKAVVIMLDDEIVTAPTADSKIVGTNCEITSKAGGYSKDEASNTAALIRGGALPISLHEITSSVQTATIGVDALNKSVVAGAIGLGLVFLLMLIMYNMLGLIADIALMLYVLLVLWIMAGMGSVLTLPGIAGIILSIGMAVDANVIIFARIKEEIAAGKTIRVAVDQGFRHALTTVLDAQITTLIASVVLYEIGSTAVKGFALTLMIGIIVSIFTAVAITQLFVGLLAGSKMAKNKYFGVNEDGTPKTFLKKEFKFIGNRKIFYCFSAVIIIAGLVFAGIRGFNYGIDFTGGTMIQVDMGKTVETEEVKDALADFEMKDLSVVLAGDNQDQIIIKTIDALNNKERAEVVDTLAEKYDISDKSVLASEEFGPTVGRELKGNALKSVLIAAVGMLIYIIFRFKSWKYGVSSIAGVFHDVLFVLAFYAIFNVTINNPFIAGILTVVGYSINDTIVIFDRIRENKKIFKKDSNEVVIDRSVNQTLNRSIMTSLTTLICMVPLFLMVSTSIREFVLPLMVGVLVGTYSSIFLCSPLFYEFSKGEDQSKYLTAQKNKEKTSKKSPKKNK